MARRGHGQGRGWIRAVALGVCLGLLAAVGGARASDSKLKGLDGSVEELMAWLASEEGKWVRARELAEKVLAAHPDSWAGHYVLGAAMHYGEGDLARSSYHLEQALALFEKKHGKAPEDDTPWRWHELTLRELAATLGEMERPGPELIILDRYDEAYQPKRLAQRVWPLMKLRRYKEARESARLAIASGNREQMMIARSDLCAAECEAGDRESAFHACTAALELHQKQPEGGQVEFSNASESALSVLRFDDAERFLQESTRRASPESWGNPYQHLAQLYLFEGRVPEAIAALQSGQELRLRRPAWLDQHGQARLDQSVASLLLVVGQTERAAQMAERAWARPDRQGVHSGTERQARSATAILLTTVLRDRARRHEEDATTAGLWEGLKLRARAWKERYAAWQYERRAAVFLADQEFLVRTLRPYYVGGADLPQWLVAEVVGMVGAGVTLRALGEARAVEKFGASPSYFDAFEAEAEFRQGHWTRALEVAERALGRLPHAEVLLQGRVAAIAAEAAWEQGDGVRAVQHFATALTKDPDVLRRLDLRLPVGIESDGSPLGEAARSLVERSPRFRVSGGRGSATHLVSLRGDGGGAQACLLGPRHEVVQCATVRPMQGSAPKEIARQLVAELHRVGFAYKADLSQADLTSLDGSPTAARADRQVNSLLEQLGPAEH